jgi:hypothetical protein
MEPHPKARSLMLELAMMGKDIRGHGTTLFALRALMMMVFPMTVVIMVIVVLPMLMMVFPVVVVERRLLQRPSKRSAEEIGNLQRLGLDAIMEPVTAPSARAVMLDGLVSSSCWPGSVRTLEPCDCPGLVRDWVPEAEMFECGAVVGDGVGVGGGGDAACD